MIFFELTEMKTFVVAIHRRIGTRLPTGPWLGCLGGALGSHGLWWDSQVGAAGELWGPMASGPSTDKARFDLMSPTGALEHNLVRAP